MNTKKRTGMRENSNDVKRLKGEIIGKKFSLWWRNLNIKNKFLISTGILIILITVVVLIAVNYVITTNMLKNKREMVTRTVASVDSHIKERREILEKYVIFMAKNTSFVEAINVALFTEEYEEISKLSLNFQKEIGVERVIVCRPSDGDKCKLLAYTTGEKEPGELVPMHGLCREAEKKDIASLMLYEDGMFNLKVCGTIKKRGELVAFIVIDDILGTDFADQIETSTGAEISLLEITEYNTGKVITAAHRDLIGKEITEKCIGKMQSTLKTTYLSNYKVGGETHMVAFKPLLDQKNEILGILMILVHMDDVINMKKSIVTAMLITGLLVIIIGIFAISRIVRTIIAPLRQLLLTAQAIGKGDLTQKIADSGANEIGQLSSMFTQMQDSLINMVGQIRHSTQLVDSSITELISSSQQQASGAEEQSTALTETSSTIEELASASKHIAENARSVAELAGLSLSGMETIQTNTTQEAERILTLGEKSQSIGEVVGMIDDIARQTNLLALNASIEAARAGEAGKGFAVVAIEIRKLATNVANSTKQIREIIKEIQDATNSSVLATENVGKSVEKGIELSKKTADSSSQISKATQQQRSASDQIVTTIKEMVSISEQSATVATKISDTTNKLAQLTKEQRQLVEKFKIERIKYEQG